MATKKWWLAEEVRVIVPDFDARVEAHLATLPPKARPQSEVARLREELAALKAQQTEPPVPA
ncbi:MAG: hypothetical protein L0170_05450 [Acidobacteria bacterium]|nr:hypothetical protein [Acidobacteriota bacterium]